MGEESDHFKDKSIPCRMENCEKKYKDIFLMFGTELVDLSSKRLKHERVDCCRKNISFLANMARTEVDKINERIQRVRGKQGYHEEEDFWVGMLKKGTNVLTSVADVDRKSEELYSLFRDEFGEFNTEKAHSRKVWKNKKKTTKRLQQKPKMP